MRNGAVVHVPLFIHIPSALMYSSTFACMHRISTNSRTHARPFSRNNRYQNEWWRFVTPIFLHAGLIHLAFNVYVQAKIGSDLEAMWGTSTWIAIFLVSGVGGNLASAIFLPTSIGVGASGSIMGMLGAWLVDLIMHWGDDKPENFLDPAAAKLNRKERKKAIVMLSINIIITFCLRYATPRLPFFCCK